MTEDEFRKAMRAQVDDHLKRLEEAYTCLFHNSGVLINLARNDGVGIEEMKQIIDLENVRANASIDSLLANYARQSPSRQNH